MKYGLSDDQLSEIIAFIEKYPEVERAILFGSRAMDTYKEASDVDIAILGDQVTADLAAKIKFDFEEDTYLPFYFDIIAYPTITNEALKGHIQREGVVIFRRGWRECRLGDVITYVSRGVSPKYVESGGIPVINQKCIRNGKLIPDFLKFHDPQRKYQQEKELKIKDILINSTGVGTAGRVAMFRGKHGSIADSHVSIIRLDLNSAYPDFVFLNLRGREKELEGSAEGSTGQIELGRDKIRQLPILLPSLSEQKAIAAVLSSLDDKIDLLHRQNKTLEGMAEALFREWFVENPEREGWEMGCLGDVASDVKDNVNPNQIETDTKYVGLEHIDRKNIILKQFGFSGDVSSNKHLFLENDILFGKLRPYFHKVCFAPYSGICSTDILVIRPKMKPFFGFCLFAFFQSDVIEYANLGSGGTRMPRTDWNTLSQYPIRIPDDITLKKFNSIVLQSVQKIKGNLLQINTLENLRNTLLPKLMSGEVRVSG